MPETPTNAVLVQAALTVIRQHLDDGLPMRWAEGQAAYVPDDRTPPELWRFDDYDERFYVYSDGTMERFDNAPVTIEELETTAVTVLAALARAYQVRDILADEKDRRPGPS